MESKRTLRYSFLTSGLASNPENSANEEKRCGVSVHAKEHSFPKAHRVKYAHLIYETSDAVSLGQSEPKNTFPNQIQIDLGRYLKTRI